MHRPVICRIERVVDEARDRKTFTVKCPSIAGRARPGQFIMVWIPGVDEIPMGLSKIDPPRISFTVHAVGDATRALHRLGVGDFIGVRGPYGNGFRVVDGRALVVGGGTGMAPLMPLVKVLVDEGCSVAVVNGARSADELLFLGELERLRDEGRIRLYISTDDGSMGFKGYISELVERILSREKFDEMYVCGPELMIVKVVELAVKYGVHMQALLERYVKCAIGICGSCILDPVGLRVCRDGPVFPLEVLTRIAELGRYRRNAAGLKVEIER